MGEFDGRSVIVTGAGRGIGRAIALHLAAQGASIVAVARTRSSLLTLQEQCGARIIAADLGDAVEALRAASEAVPSDLLVNCAGTNVLDPFLEMRLESFEEVLGVNLRAVAILSQAYARDRVAREVGGAIVHISSLASTKGFSAHAAYSASKGGLDAMSRVMANELGPHGIRVNCINPGVTLTELAAEAWSAPEKSHPMLGRTPLGRFAEVEEVAELAAFLLSDRARMITGTTNLLDGGFSAA